MRKQDSVRRATLMRVVFAIAVFLLTATVLAQSKPYQGTTVRFITDRNVHQTALADKMAEVAKTMGIDFQVRYVTTDQLARKVVLDYVAGAHTWDLVYTGGVQRMYQWYNRGIISDMTPYMNRMGDDTLHWDEFTTGAKKAVTFGDKRLGVAVATSDQTLAYRKDLFNNPDEKAAFKQKYGYELQVPSTYKQFRDVAQFFTRKKGQKLAGKTLTHDFYGTSFSNKKGTYVWHDYQNMILAFGVQIYNPKTGKADFDSPQSIAAATYFKSLEPFLPPNQIELTSGESTALFNNGNVAMIIEYFDRVVSKTEKSDSPIYGDVGYALPPTQQGNPEGLKHPFRSGPAIVSLYSLSDHKDAAYALLQKSITSANEYDMAVTHTGYIPTKVPALQKLISKDPYVDYLVRAAKQSDERTDAAIMPYPSILKSSEIGDIVSNAISSILTGSDVKPQIETAQQKLQALFKDLPKQ